MSDSPPCPLLFLIVQEGPAWAIGTPLPLIKVEHVGQRSKFKGLKNYEAYMLTGLVSPCPHRQLRSCELIAPTPTPLLINLISHADQLLG